MADKDCEWTLTVSEVLDRDVTEGKSARPDPEAHRPKADPETWTLAEPAVVRVKGDYYYGWNWSRPKRVP